MEEEAIPRVILSVMSDNSFCCYYSTSWLTFAKFFLLSSNCRQFGLKSGNIVEFLFEFAFRSEKNIKTSTPETLPLHPEVSPQRFTSREMMMLQNSVQVSHSHSVLISCRMLINKEKYPPPDLLFLIMKKYLLVSLTSRLMQMCFDQDGPFMTS